MKTHFPFVLVLAVLAILAGCSKSANSDTSSTQAMLTGTWSYNSSYRTDTVYNNGAVSQAQGNYYPKANLISQTNYLVFTTDGTAYCAESAWGRGVSGAIFRDTVPYTIKGNIVLLSYPSGVNVYSWPNFNYPAYQDTITITSLSAGTLTIKRNYHYKHLLMSGTEWDTKQSVDTLTK